MKHQSRLKVLQKLYINTNYEEDDPDTVILIRRLAWNIKSEKKNI